MTKRKLVRGLCYLGVVTCLTACMTPGAVKKLSTRITEYQTAYCEVASEYFQGMDAFLEGYQRMTIDDIERNYKKNIDETRKGLIEDLEDELRKAQANAEKDQADEGGTQDNRDGPPAMVPPKQEPTSPSLSVDRASELAKQIATKVEEQRKTADGQIANLKTAITVLKGHSAQLREHCEKIGMGQQTLDDWVQLEKFAEHVFSRARAELEIRKPELANQIGKVREAFDKAATR